MKVAKRLLSPECIPTRLVVGLMIFFAKFIISMLQVNISIIIIAMVESAADSGLAGEHVPECLEFGQNKTWTNSTARGFRANGLSDYGVRYPWDSKMQGLILGSYSWGFILTSIPGGFLSERYGPRLTLAIAGFMSAILTIVIPFAASWHFVAVVALRFLTGLFGGFVSPAAHCLIARWAPPEEKGLFINTFLGSTLGTMLTWTILGYVIETFGWIWGFFGTGLVALAWCCLWVFLVADSPQQHSRISEKESNYIAESLGGSVSSTDVKIVPPYREILTSVPFWALNFLHMGTDWGWFFLLTAGPKYMSEVLGFNLSNTGLLSALPYLLRILFGFVFGYIGDIIRKRQWMSVSGTRKTFVAASHFSPALLLIGVILSGCDVTLCVAFIALSFGLNSAEVVTNAQNNHDLAPNFAGTIYGIMNFFGGATGFVSPVITGYLTAEHNGLKEWHIIFSIGAGVYIATGIVFCIFGSGKEQPWNQIPKSEPSKKEEGTNDNSV